MFATMLVACGGSGGGEPSPSPSAPLPSGELGVVTPIGASAAVLGLCAARAAVSSSAMRANALFEDRAHEELHVIAAATQAEDTQTAARLLEAMQTVEADFADHAPTSTTGTDVDALLAATRTALATIGLPAPTCPA